jgi:hypothetical protein
MGGNETPTRLLKGAQKLGEFWRDGDRCALGWSSAIRPCGCEPETRFCEARALWAELALADGRVPEDGPHDLSLMMRAFEWDATGLTMTVELGSHGTVRIGPKGSLRMADLVALAEAPEGADVVLKVMGFFPGAVIEKVLKPGEQDGQRQQGDPGGQPDAGP